MVVNVGAEYFRQQVAQQQSSSSSNRGSSSNMAPISRGGYSTIDGGYHDSRGNVIATPKQIKDNPTKTRSEALLNSSKSFDPAANFFNNLNKNDMMSHAGTSSAKYGYVDSVGKQLASSDAIHKAIQTKQLAALQNQVKARESQIKTQNFKQSPLMANHVVNVRDAMSRENFNSDRAAIVAKSKQNSRLPQDIISRTSVGSSPSVERLFGRAEHLNNYDTSKLNINIDYGKVVTDAKKAPIKLLSPGDDNYIGSEIIGGTTTRDESIQDVKEFYGGENIDAITKTKDAGDAKYWENKEAINKLVVGLGKAQKVYDKQAADRNFFSDFLDGGPLSGQALAEEKIMMLADPTWAGPDAGKTIQETAKKQVDERFSEVYGLGGRSMEYTKKGQLPETYADKFIRASSKNPERADDILQSLKAKKIGDDKLRMLYPDVALQQLEYSALTHPTGFWDNSVAQYNKGDKSIGYIQELNERDMAERNAVEDMVETRIQNIENTWGSKTLSNNQTVSEYLSTAEGKKIAAAEAQESFLDYQKTLPVGERDGIETYTPSEFDLMYSLKKNDLENIHATQLKDFITEHMHEQNVYHEDGSLTKEFVLNNEESATIGNELTNKQNTERNNFFSELGTSAEGFGYTPEELTKLNTLDVFDKRNSVSALKIFDAVKHMDMTVYGDDNLDDKQKEEKQKVIWSGASLALNNMLKKVGGESVKGVQGMGRWSYDTITGAELDVKSLMRSKSSTVDISSILGTKTTSQKAITGAKQVAFLAAAAATAGASGAGAKAAYGVAEFAVTAPIFIAAGTGATQALGYNLAGTRKYDNYKKLSGVKNYFDVSAVESSWDNPIKKSIRDTKDFDSLMRAGKSSEQSVIDKGWGPEGFETFGWARGIASDLPFSGVIPGVKNVIGSEKTFEESVRQQYKTRGYTDEQIDIAVAGALNQRVSTEVGATLGFIGANTASEILGRHVISKALLSATKQKSFSKGFLSIAPAGYLEGGAIEMMRQDKMYEDRDYDKVASAQAQGYVSAGLVGGAMTWSGPTGFVNKALTRGGYIVDPNEWIGDKIADLIAKLVPAIGKYTGNVRPKVFTVSTIVGGGSTISENVNAADIVGSSVDSTGNTILKTKSKVYVLSNTKANVNALSSMDTYIKDEQKYIRKGSSTNSFSNILSNTNTKSDINKALSKELNIKSQISGTEVVSNSLNTMAQDDTLSDKKQSSLEQIKNMIQSDTQVNSNVNINPNVNLNTQAQTQAQVEVQAQAQAQAETLSETLTQTNVNPRSTVFSNFAPLVLPYGRVSMPQGYGKGKRGKFLDSWVVQNKIQDYAQQFFSKQKTGYDKANTSVDMMFGKNIASGKSFRNTYNNKDNMFSQMKNVFDMKKTPTAKTKKMFNTAQFGVNTRAASQKTSRTNKMKNMFRMGKTNTSKLKISRMPMFGGK